MHLNPNVQIKEDTCLGCFHTSGTKVSALLIGTEKVLLVLLLLLYVKVNSIIVGICSSGKPDEEKERLWNEVFHLVSCIPQNQMVVFAGDTKQESKLVTYVAGPVKSTIDYITVRQEDKAKIRNSKVISSEECVPKHKLLVMDMWFKATKSWRL